MLEVRVGQAMAKSKENPYKCSTCSEKSFKTLVGLRIHSSIAHATIEMPESNGDVATEKGSNLKDGKLLYEAAMKSRNLAVGSETLKDMPGAIDKLFERFNKRAEMLLRKYDRSFAEIEEELKLSGKLRVIKKRKEKLKADLEELDGHKPRVFTHDSEESFSSQNYSDDEQAKDEFSEKELKHAQANHINNAKTRSNLDDALQKKLRLSIQLAAKYKEEAIETANRLQDVASSEQQLRLYLQQAAQQEAEAKVRLQEFITGLLERAEKAEERVKSYKSRLSSYGSTFGRKSLEKRSLPRSASTLSSRAVDHLKPPNMRAYSSSAPTTPPAPHNRSKRNRKQSPRHLDDSYVSQILVAPSSQELPRRWNRMKDRTVDQLPGVDLANVIDTSVMWPFADNSHSPRPSRYGRSPSPENSSVSLGAVAGHDNDVAIKRRIVLFCVFAYLDSETLLRCSLISKEWRDVSKHPKLWTRVSLDSKQITSEFLATLSAWCKETCYISLSNINGRSRYPGETSKEYNEATAGILDDGMECFLQACGNNLAVLSINKCDPFISRRVLWMASCYNRELKSVTFRSSNPLNAEVAWSLGAGCRKLLSLDIAPLKTCKSPAVFNNRVLQTVSWCWPTLKGLSVGGRCIDKKGLMSIATNCHSLQVLELLHMNEMTEDLAKDLSKHGFRSLCSLMLTHTPIRTRALNCLLQLSRQRSLTSLRVQLSFADYCPTHDDEPAIILGENLNRSELFEAFNAVMQSLLRLQKKPEHKNILEVICTA